MYDCVIPLCFIASANLACICTSVIIYVTSHKNNMYDSDKFSWLIAVRHSKLLTRDTNDKPMFDVQEFQQVLYKGHEAIWWNRFRVVLACAALREYTRALQRVHSTPATSNIWRISERTFRRTSDGNMQNFRYANRWQREFPETLTNTFDYPHPTPFKARGLLLSNHWQRNRYAIIM